MSAGQANQPKVINARTAGCRKFPNVQAGIPHAQQLILIKTTRQALNFIRNDAWNVALHG
jgi:hypothetical protein